MKKQIAIVAATLAAVCCLGGCGEKAENQYDVLNRMLDAEYTKIQLDVTDTFDNNITLTSVYSINYNLTTVTVNYAVERFVEISLDNPAANEVELISGVATIRNGEVIEDTGGLGLTADIATLTLAFKKTYFANTLFTDEVFRADVTYAPGFMGTRFVAEDMKLLAYHKNFEVFDRIEISYTSATGNAVEYVYTFTI